MLHKVLEHVYEQLDLALVVRHLKPTNIGSGGIMECKIEVSKPSFSSPYIFKSSPSTFLKLLLEAWKPMPFEILEIGWEARRKSCHCRPRCV